MNKEKLFEYLETQDQTKLLELLNIAYDAIDTNQRHEVFGKTIVEVPPSPAHGSRKLISSISRNLLLMDSRISFTSSAGVG